MFLLFPGCKEFQSHGVPGEVNASHHTGTAILFPSHVTHRVLPVTRGERHSLVLWLKLDAAGGWGGRHVVLHALL